MSAEDSEVLAAFELERLLHRAASTRFERTAAGFVCANPDLPMVWDASRAQVEPDAEMPTAEELIALAGKPTEWHPGLRHRTAFLPGHGEGREVAYSLVRRGWEVSEQWLMFTRTPPRSVPRTAGRLEGAAMRRLKGRLGVEQGLPPDSVAQFDRYDDLRSRAAARVTIGGFVGPAAMAIADMYLRGDIAVIEDVATLRRGQGKGLATATVLGATAAALRLSARAVYLFAAPEIARGLYEPLGYERLASAWECRLRPPGRSPGS